MALSKSAENGGTGRKVATFQPGDVLADFGVDWFTFADCAKWLCRRLHPAGPACPSCSTPPTSEAALTTFFMFGRVKCSACGVRYNAATGTMIEGSKLDAREIILMALFIALNIPAETIAEVLHIHKDTVRNWRAKFKALEGMGA